MQGFGADQRIHNEVKVTGNAEKGLFRKDVGMPLAVCVFLDERTAVAPNPGGKVVRKVPVAPAWECVAPYMGAVFKNFVFVVDFANGVFEAFVGLDRIFGNAVFCKNALVCKARAIRNNFCGS